MIISIVQISDKPRSRNNRLADQMLSEMRIRRISEIRAPKS